MLEESSWRLLTHGSEEVSFSTDVGASLIQIEPVLRVEFENEYSPGHLTSKRYSKRAARLWPLLPLPSRASGTPPRACASEPGNRFLSELRRSTKVSRTLVVKLTRSVPRSKGKQSNPLRQRRCTPRLGRKGYIRRHWCEGKRDRILAYLPTAARTWFQEQSNDFLPDHCNDLLLPRRSQS